MRMLTIVVLAAAAAACSSKKQTRAAVTEVPRARAPGADGRAAAPQPAADEAGRGGAPRLPGFATIYFAYDRADLDDTARDVLVQVSRALADDDSLAVTLEGHADERGTPEYNLALGDQRAQACQRYLVRLGVPAARVRAVSYGEERPVEAGADEDAWSKNRRVEIVVTRTP